MANKREKEKRAAENAKKVYDGEIKKLYKFVYMGFGFIALALVLCFCNWIYVDNSNSGVEVSVSGYSFLCAFLSGNYNSTDVKIFGDIAIPFYYYAKDACSQIGFFTFLAILFCIVSAVFGGVFLITPSKKIKSAAEYGACGCSALSCAFFLVSFIVAVLVKNSDILPVFCSGNSACSIKSLAILSAIAVGAAAVNFVYSTVKLIKLNRRFS